jgi:hypothetical protein
MNNNPNGNPTDQTDEQLAAFQRIWMESMAKMVQAGFAVSSNPPPREVLSEMRNGLFRTLAQSWEEFLRSPEFLESMKQLMGQAISFRKMTNDFLGQARNEMQAPSLDDLHSVMLSIRHSEKRLLDRLEELSARVNELNDRLPAIPRKSAASKAAAPKARPGAHSKKSPIGKAAGW